jgi:energy-converting hydrogenase Eha subunit F
VRRFIELTNGWLSGWLNGFSAQVKKYTKQNGTSIYSKNELLILILNVKVLVADSVFV